MRSLNNRISVILALLLAVAAIGVLLVVPTAKADGPVPPPRVLQYLYFEEDPTKATVESSETVCRPEDGDLDHDGLGDACDPAPNNPDADNDGFPDSTEIRIGTDPLSAASWPFDINGDGKADAADLLKFGGKLGKRTIDVAYDRRFDLNVDGRVDTADLSTLRSVLGKKTPVGGASAASSGYYAAAASTWSHSCSHSYTGKTWWGLAVYQLGLTESYWGYMTQDGIAGFSNPPSYYYAKTMPLAVGWSYSDLSGTAKRIGPDTRSNIQASTHATFKLQDPAGRTVQMVTRWVWLNIYGNRGLSSCGKYAR